jgi:hypothetical protein
MSVGLLSAITALAAAAALAVSALALPTSTQTSNRRLTVGLKVLRIAPAGRKLRGVALVTTTLANRNGHARRVKTKVAFTTASLHRCNILTLILHKLHLSLLGLNIDLSKVVLKVTGIPSGHPGGGLLGSLSCKLASTRLGPAKRAAVAKRLSADLRRHRLFRFRVHLHPGATTTKPGATCPVLNLVLGPLHLNLLGLVVDLNQVHLKVTATQGGGVLGNLFCSLSTGTTSTTATPATASPTAAAP